MALGRRYLNCFYYYNTRYNRTGQYNSTRLPKTSFSLVLLLIWDGRSVAVRWLLFPSKSREEEALPFDLATSARRQ
jgi:hypothetical protein